MVPRLSILTMGLPRISTVVAVLNGEKTLRRCLASVAEQDYPERELIIIDGASSDGTLDIIREYEESISFWDSAEDGGIYHAWNKGVDRASGDWVHFLGADDRYTAPDVLRRIAVRLGSLPQSARIAYGQVALVDSTGVVLEILGQPWAQARSHLGSRMSIPPVGTFSRRILFAERGRFNEAFQVAGDYEFFLRELTRREPYFMYDIVVACWALGGVSSSPENGPVIRQEDALARRLNGLFPYPPIWWWEYFKSLAFRTLHRTIGQRWAARIRRAYRKLTGSPLRPE
jgi:glycosyltransferase involved in cell wall biosynthesis